MEYLRYLPVSTVALWAASIGAMALAGVASQRRWRLAGPLVVLVLVVAATATAGAWVLNFQARPVPLLFVAGGLPSALTCAALMSLNRWPVAARVVAGLAAGTLAVLVAPPVLVLIACGAYGACP